MEGRVWAWCRPFRCCRRVAGPGKRGHRPGDVGGSRWAFVCARYHRLLRLAPILWESVAPVGQVDVVPVGVSDRQRASLGCTRGSFWAGLARPGSSRLIVECAVVCVTSMGWPPGGWRHPRSRVISSLAHGRRGIPVARVWLCAAAAGPVAGCGSGSCGFLRRRTRALRRVPKISCTRVVRTARASFAVRMAGCRRSPSASARIWWIAVFDNTPAVIGLAVGPACMAGPFARSLMVSLRGRRGSGGMPGLCVALPPFPVAGGSGGPGGAAVVRGMWEVVVGASFVSDTMSC